VIHLRRPSQYTFGDGLIAEHTDELWEDWMRRADKVLEDEQLLQAVHEALSRRRPKSRTRGRLGVPAEIVVRMLLLKHLRDWSFDVVEREVRANLVYREFTRVGAGKVPGQNAGTSVAGARSRSYRKDASARGGAGS
jgi:IS5 family transposase